MKQKFALRSWVFNLLFALLLALVYNQPLWHLVLSQSPPDTFNRLLFDLSFVLFVWTVLNILVSLLAFRRVIKPVAVGLLLSAASVLYFMHSYAVVIDKSMVQNLFETDVAEVQELLNLRLGLYLGLLGIAPALLIIKLPIRYERRWIELRDRSLSIALSVLVIVLIAGAFYKDYASFFRNHREVRNLAVPTNYLYYSLRYLSGAYAGEQAPLQAVGRDAQLQPAVWQALERPVLTVVVVGETARAQNLSLNGYERETNPELAQEAILNFGAARACGTATAISVPCMFSDLDQSHYSDEGGHARENLLDVLQRAGLSVLWRDNNSGCKGVCERVAHEDQRTFCRTEACFDEAMLEQLDGYLASLERGGVLVLHQQGSHGPAYAKRYPAQYGRFTPVCENSDLNACSQPSIVNAYDNSILYTDHFLAQVIAYLKARSDRFTTAMVYLSDHGESLGENNLYLHGMPYFLAPEEQTRVPFLAWLSDDYQQRFGLDATCLQRQQHQSASQDNLFHSVLGLLAVNTAAYQAELDLFGACRGPVVAQAAQMADRS